MRKTIIDKADRIFKIPASIGINSSIAYARRRIRGTDIIDLGEIKYEAFADAGFSGEAGALLGNTDMRRKATREEVRETIKLLADFYYDKFNVKLHRRSSITIITPFVPSEILLSLSIINPNDGIALCNPCDPVFRNAAALSSGSVVSVPISERTDFLPPIISEMENAKHKLKLNFINYPHNPTGAVADLDFFNRQIKAASDGDYLLCHRLGFTGTAIGYSRPTSMLEATGSKKVGLELFGFNLGFGLPKRMLEIAVGSPDAISILKEINFILNGNSSLYILKLMESAINHYENATTEAAKKIKTNAEILSDGLKGLGWRTYIHKGSPFIWASHPKRKSSLNLSKTLFDRAGIIISPGIRFGENGEGAVRFSLTASEAEIASAVKRISRTLHPIKRGKSLIDKRIKKFRDGQDSN